MAFPGLQNASRFENEDKVGGDQEISIVNESEDDEGCRESKVTNKETVQKRPTRSLPQIESQCPICYFPTGFHKIYHLATRHFKKRLLATLPITEPFKCPDCERFNSKSRSKLWIHYLGKHNYWKKWVDDMMHPSSTSNSSSDTTLQCNFCKKLLGNQIDLKDHIDEFHSWYKCTKCSKSFSCKSKWEGKF